MPSLLLGPMLRYADASAATIWVQTDEPCEVEVLGVRERTWCVAGAHYALVAIRGLEPGIGHPYEVRLDGERVWPAAGDHRPASVLRLPPAGGELRLAFGSCRISLPHEPPYTKRAHEHPDGQGIDALRALAVRAAEASEPGEVLPHTLLMLGDQIYADQPSPKLREQLAARSDRPEQVPDGILADTADYALAYREAWQEPEVRWLLSTVPTAMIFDDHEIHAEWKISRGWLDEMQAEPWFEEHIRSGLIAYWIYQHLGNLSPDELDASDLYARVRAAGDARELLGAALCDAERQSGHSRWSHARRIGPAQLVVIDSRAGRDVTPGARRLVQDEEFDWIEQQAREPAEHLLLASSVPFLLASGLHHIEAFDEALADGAWGRALRGTGERLRRLGVMDHWASFQHTHRRVGELVDDAARGDGAPLSIVMLSGDVHHCYLAQVGFASAARSAVWQVVCSGFRKELAPHEKAVIRFGHTRLAGRLARRLARGAGVAPLPFDWRIVERPDYGNQVSTLTLSTTRAHVRSEAIDGDDWRAPRLQTVFEHELAGAGAGDRSEAQADAVEASV